MLHTVSLFDAIEQDGTQQRTAARQALALADTRVERSLGSFLRGARSVTEFNERLALVADDFTSLVLTAANELGYEHPEHIAKSLRDHYRLAVEEAEEEDLDSEDEDEEELEKDEKTSKRTWTPRIAAPAGDYSGFLGPNPHDVPGNNFYDSQGQLAPDPMRNDQGYIRPGVPMGVGGQDEGYENIPYGVDPRAQTQRDYGNDQGLQIQPNLPPVTVPPGAPIHQGSAAGKQSAPLVRSADKRVTPKGEVPQDTTAQIDNSSKLVACPQCGGSGQSNSGQTCHTCKGKGKVPNFGDSMVDALAQKDARIAGEDGAHGNTDLDGPEPKMDKGIWLEKELPELEEIGNATTVRKDPVSPIPARNSDPLSEIGELKGERQKLPANDGDAGFNNNNQTQAPHTKTFDGKGQADPVTREAISNANPLVEYLEQTWPSDAIVEAAFNRN